MRIKEFLENEIHAQIKVIMRSFNYKVFLRGSGSDKMRKKFSYKLGICSPYKISLTYLRILAMVRESRLSAWSLDTPMILSWSLDIPMTMFWSLESSMILC